MEKVHKILTILTVTLLENRENSVYSYRLHTCVISNRITVVLLVSGRHISINLLSSALRNYRKS